MLCDYAGSTASPSKCLSFLGNYHHPVKIKAQVKYPHLDFINFAAQNLNPLF